MRVIPPLAITPSILTSSGATEPMAPATWGAGTTYGNGALVLVTADHMIYQSLHAANTGNTPNVSPLDWDPVGFIEAAYNSGTTYGAADTASYLHRIYQSLQASNIGHTPLTSPTWWTDVGATNTWRMFDILRNTQTVNASPLVVVLTPGVRVDSIALLGLTADAVQISMTSSPFGTVYDQTVSLVTRIIANWYDYFFLPFYSKLATAKFDLPPYSNGIITITITRASGNVGCGSLVLGTSVYLGKARYNAQNDTLNFSTVDRDAFGNSILVPRRNVPKTIQQTEATSASVNLLRAVRDILNAVPAVWSGLDDSGAEYFEALLILGFYRKFSIDLSYPRNAMINIELEEV